MAKQKVKIKDPSTPVDYVQFGPAMRRELTPEGGSLTADQALLVTRLEQGDETNRLLAELVYRMENMLWLR
jgi:hypothetical protein